ATPALAALVALGMASHAGTWIGSRINAMANASLAAVVCLLGMVGYALFQHKSIERLPPEVRSQVRADDQLLAISRYPFSLGFYCAPINQSWWSMAGMPHPSSARTTGARNSTKLPNSTLTVGAGCCCAHRSSKRLCARGGRGCLATPRSPIALRVCS